MAAEFDLKNESTTNPCCSLWRDKCLKLQQKAKKIEDSRAALKQTANIYELQFEKVQDQSRKLKKAYEEEKLKTDHERKEKEKESAARVSMENEISALKAEILALNKNGGSVSENVSEEVVLLKESLLEKEKEIRCLQEESKRVKAEKSSIEHELSNLKIQLVNVEAGQKKLMQDLQKEKARVDSEKNRADETLKSFKTEQAEVEALKAEKKNSDLCVPSSELLNLKTELAQIKELLENERIRADGEAKKAEIEKQNAHNLKDMLKAEQSKADEQRKMVDIERKKAEEFAKTKQAEVEALKAEKKNSDLCVSTSEVRNFETEIAQIKELLENERRRADCEAKKAETEKKRDLELKKKLKTEHSRADEQRKMVDVERKKDEEFPKTKQSEVEAVKAEKKNSDLCVSTAEVRKFETEIAQIKELLENERKRADCEAKKAETEKKRALELKKKLKTEQSRADEQRKMVDVERKKAEEIAKTKQAEVEALEAEKKNSDSCVPTSEIRKFETEIAQIKELLENERKRADCEAKKAETEKKRALELKKKLKTEQSRADEQRKMVDVERKKAEEFAKTKQAEVEALEAEKKNSDSCVPTSEIRKFETEIAQIKELLEYERIRADGEAKKAEIEKQNAHKLKEMLNAEQSKADEQRKMIDIERKKAAEFAKTKQAEVEALKAEKNNSELCVPASEILNLKTELAQIKELLENERIRADGEAKKAEIEKQYAHNLKEMLKTEQSKADEQRKMVDVERKKAEEFAKTKQAEVEALKAEKKNSELCVPTSEIRNFETEIAQIKELIEIERKRANGEAKKAETEKKEAHKLKEKLKAQQSRADEQRKMVEVERKKAEELSKQLQRSKCEADEAKSKLDSEVLKAKEANKKFEAEKKKSIKEKKKAEEQQKIAEMSTKHALEEKQKAVRLQQQLDDCQNECNKLKRNIQNYEAKMKIYEQLKEKTNVGGSGAYLDTEKETEYKKVAETYKLQAMKEKSRADKLAQELEDTRTQTKNEQRVLQDLVSSKNLTGTMKTDSAEMKFLMKRLKHKKDRVNHFKDRAQHFKEVAELETKRKKTVEEELDNLKLEFAQFSRRLGLCSCFDICNVGKTCVEKNGNVNSKRELLRTGSGKELEKPTKRSECFKPIDISAPSLPISGTCTESTSGTDSKMEPLHNRTNLDSFALVSSIASFSDRQLVVGTQENARLPICWLPTKNAQVADNNFKSPLKVRNKDGNTKKRKWLLSATEGETARAKVAKNASELHGVLGQIDKPLTIEHNQEATRTVANVDSNAFEKTSNVDLENFKKIFDGDCLNLLSLDDELEEKRYRAAVERPLSPGLPNIELESNLIVLDDVRPPETEMPTESWSIVVFSEIRDSGSLSKIVHTTKSFSSDFRTFYQTGLLVQNVISALLADETLSPKQKVCVFFSLFLKSFSGSALTNLDNANDWNYLSGIHVISGQLKKVMSDVETRTRFAKVCDLEELITLSQNFLINGEMLVCSTITSSETQSLPESKASLDELVIGAVLLASVCEAFDRVDFIREISYTISGVTSSLSLTLLHVFATVCGEKLLLHGDSNLIMTVIKSLVTYCEKENLSSGFPSCSKCPFSVGAVSMEELASLLLTKLSDCAVHMSGVMAFKSSTIPDDTLSDLGNVLTLLELVATKMSWGWVCKNIVSGLLNLLDACAKEVPLTALFVLLGQMARLGIDANGLEDAEVEIIRAKLISFISEHTSRKVSLRVQFGAVTALLGITPLSFEEICKTSVEHPPHVSSATDCIRRWFCSQNDEGKSLFVRLLTADGS